MDDEPANGTVVRTHSAGARMLVTRTKQGVSLAPFIIIDLSLIASIA